MFSNKIKLQIIILLLTLSTALCYSQTADSSETGNVPTGTTEQVSLEEKFYLEKGLIDVSAVFSGTFRSSQQILSIGAQGAYFIHDILETGLKISTESFYDYDLIIEFSALFRIFFLKKSASLPFFNLETGYAAGKKLSGFFIRGGFGMLQHIKGIFNVFIIASAELWIFTYRYNQDTGLVDALSQTYFDKYHIDFRIIFGCSFTFNRKD